MNFAQTLADQFSLQTWQTEKVIELIDEGNTIPFIARYRKEAHGSLDDQTLRELSERLEYLRGLEKRREEVRGLIDAAGALTPEVAAALDAASTLAELDDVYRPYRPKRRTRASVAKERGLEPLAELLPRAEARRGSARRGGALCGRGQGRPDGGRRSRRGARHHRGVRLRRRFSPQAAARRRHGAGGACLEGREARRGFRLRPVLRLSPAGAAGGGPPCAGRRPRRARGLFEGLDRLRSRPRPVDCRVRLRARRVRLHGAGAHGRRGTATTV